MAFTYTKGASPQGLTLYELLLKRGVRTAKQVGEDLHIHPNAVYRLADYLAKIGLIEEISGRPTTFRALPASEGRENYLAYQRSHLDEVFARPAPEETKRGSQDYHISFIQGREEIFQKLASDLNQAKREARFIVLGLPIGVSPELMLAQRNTVKRGVPVRIIAQEYTDKNRETLKSWKKQGLDVRYGKPIGFHLLLIDDAISYLMYYDPQDKTKRHAVRIIHKAINQELQAIFITHWREAKPVQL